MGGPLNPMRRLLAMALAVARSPAKAFKGTRLPIQHSRHCTGPDFLTPAAFSCSLRLGLAGGEWRGRAHGARGLGAQRQRREVSKTNRKAGG